MLQCGAKNVGYCRRGARATVPTVLLPSSVMRMRRPEDPKVSLPYIRALTEIICWADDIWRLVCTRRLAELLKPGDCVQLQRALRRDEDTAWKMITESVLYGRPA